MTIKDLIKAKSNFDKMEMPKVNYSQVHSIGAWQQLRKTNLCYAEWSDEELNNFDKENGYIGKKCGVDCYVYVDFKSTINRFNAV